MIKRKNYFLYLLLALISVVVLVLHFAWLSNFPPGMYHDEIEYALSSKSYALLGTDLSGASFPLSLFKTQTLGQISAIPPLILSPLWNIFPLNQTTIRLSYILLNLLTAITLFFFVTKLFSNKKLATVATLLFLLNPWSFFLSRFSVDAAFALFFYLLGITLLFKNTGWKLALAYIALLLGFFSYNGAKLLFIPLVLVICLYNIWYFKKGRKPQLQQVVFIAFSLIFLLVFYITTKHIPDSILALRSNEISFLDNATISQNVNLFRTQAIYTPFAAIFINKLSYIFELLLQNYFSAFSFDNLFITGDPTSVTGFYYHGLFYLIDLPFLLLGIILLFKKQKHIAYFLTALILISPIATASSTHGQSIINRSFLLLPVFITLIAYGTLAAYKLIRNKRAALTIFFALLYLFSFSNFLYLYFFRLPILAQENYAVSNRVLAKYLQLTANSNSKVVVVGDEPRELYLESVFYSPNQKQTNLLKQMETAKDPKTFSMDNITFTQDCPTTFTKNTQYIVQRTIKGCIVAKHPNYLIIDQKDAGYIFKIYHSNLCNDTTITRWRNRNTIADYNIEPMDRKTFCQEWIATHD